MEIIKEKFKSSFSARFFEEINLKAQIKAIFEELEDKYHELKFIEGELSSFTNNYYSEVGDLIIELEELECAINNNCGSKAENAEPLNDGKAININNDIKQIYKKLARKHHPDVSGKSEQGKIQQINQAYSDRNFIELKRMQIAEEFTEANEPVEVKIARLRVKLQSAENAFFKVNKQLSNLKISPEYELMQKALFAKICGNNLIAEIKDDLENKIQKLRSQIACEASAPLEKEEA